MNVNMLGGWLLLWGIGAVGYDDVDEDQRCTMYGDGEWVGDVDLTTMLVQLRLRMAGGGNPNECKVTGDDDDDRMGDARTMMTTMMTRMG